MNSEFLKRMKAYLKEEYSAFEKSFANAMFRGIRVNTSKISIADFKALDVCGLKPNKFCEESFEIDQACRLGNHFAHKAGLFYMQELSASAVVEALDVKRGEWICDLCGAPGGKSTQIANKLEDSGFLLSNEIDYQRATVLLSNMERLGYSQCMITCSADHLLAKTCPGSFDKVLVDAPCSGEGMMKKHNVARDQWSIQTILSCAERQKEILESAYVICKDQGYIVYSTCTYAMEENEEVIAAFLKRHEDVELVAIDFPKKRGGFIGCDIDASKFMRIFPMDGGEGHFIAKMQKRGSGVKKCFKTIKKMPSNPIITRFLEDQLNEIPLFQQTVNDHVYISANPFVKLANIRILRQGICVGKLLNKRVEPNLHFYLANMLKGMHQRCYDMNDAECYSFLQGHPLPVQMEKGYVLLTWKTFSIGFGKSDGSFIKNKYPKGLRIV